MDAFNVFESEIISEQRRIYIEKGACQQSQVDQVFLDTIQDNTRRHTRADQAQVLVQLHLLQGYMDLEQLEFESGKCKIGTFICLCLCTSIILYNDFKPSHKKYSA